jgi:hypothetical protein
VTTTTTSATAAATTMTALKKKWKNNVMHPQYIRNMDRQLISEEDTFLWLSKGDLKAETESEIVAAQDQALNTKYCATNILHTEMDIQCRLCQQHDETIDRINYQHDQNWQKNNM